MSLKAFHIVFISCAVAFSLAFAAWCFSVPRGLEPALATALGVGSVVMASLVVAFERAILRNLPRPGRRSASGASR